MGKWLYDDAMYRFDRPEPSYWEASAGEMVPSAARLSGEEHCDVAVIGAGYTGLSAAYHLSRDSNLDVRVLEAGHIGWGASGRNGGFCSIGGDALGAEAMARRHGLDATRQYYGAQVDAIHLVRDLIVDENIDCQRQGDSEVSIACSPRGFRGLTDHAEFQRRALGLDAEVVRREVFAEEFYDSPVQHGGVVLRPTFGLHPLRFALGLACAAERHGAKLHAHSEVTAWTKVGQHHELRTSSGTVRAKRVVLATNGFSPEHLRVDLQGRSLPVISSIVVTREMTADEIAMQRWQSQSPSITAISLLNYFRLLPDGRFLFGGRGSANGSEASANRNYVSLVARLHELFPQWRHIDIDYRWHGLVCMTSRATPAIGRLDDDPSVYFAFGYHGNGVNTATWSGQQIARWIGSSGASDRGTADWIPGVMQGMPGRFPFSSLRLGYLQAAIGALRVLQRFS